MKLSNKNQQFGYIKTPDPVLVVVAKASSIAIGKWKKRSGEEDEEEGEARTTKQRSA